MPKLEVVWEPDPTLLLMDNIPLPMHGLAPRIVLGENWWNKERRLAYKSTNYHCNACGVHKDKAKSRQWLEGHETYTINYQKGRMVYVKTVPLCHLCHNFLHSGRLQCLLSQRKIHHAKYAAIIQHGERLLCGLTKSPRKNCLEFVCWGDWRLLVYEKEYPPLFSSFEEYQRAYNPKGKTR